MRALGFYLADVALREAAAAGPPTATTPEPDSIGWTEELALAWRAWAIEGARELAAQRVNDAPRIRLSRPHRAGPWLPLILGIGRLGG
jgi:hypothetical protein